MTTQPESHLHSFLYRLTRRSLLSASEQHEILNLPMRLTKVAPNVDFVCLGEATTTACVVLEGLVGACGQNSRGGRQIVALHIPGDISGLRSVVHPTASTALQALTTCTVGTVPHAALRHAAAAFPGIAEAFWRDCSVDAAILAEWVVNLGRRNAMARVAHLVCEMAFRYGVVPASGSVRFALPMTQTQLADATGLTPIHVNRVLKWLGTHGLTIRHRTVWIEEWRTFAAVAEFDGSYLDGQIVPEARLRMVS